MRHRACWALARRPGARREAEAAVIGRPVDDVDADEVGELAMTGLDDIPADLQGSASYRSRVGAALVARAWTEASHGGDQCMSGRSG